MSITAVSRTFCLSSIPRIRQGWSTFLDGPTQGEQIGWSPATDAPAFADEETTVDAESFEKRPYVDFTSPQSPALPQKKQHCSLEQILLQTELGQIPSSLAKAVLEEGYLTLSRSDMPSYALQDTTSPSTNSNYFISSCMTQFQSIHPQSYYTTQSPFETQISISSSTSPLPSDSLFISYVQTTTPQYALQDLRVSTPQTSTPALFQPLERPDDYRLYTREYRVALELCVEKELPYDFPSTSMPDSVKIYRPSYFTSTTTPPEYAQTAVLVGYEAKEWTQPYKEPVSFPSMDDIFNNTPDYSLTQLQGYSTLTTEPTFDFTQPIFRNVPFVAPDNAIQSKTTYTPNIEERSGVDYVEDLPLSADTELVLDASAHSIEEVLFENEPALLQDTTVYPIFKGTFPMHILQKATPYKSTEQPVKEKPVAYDLEKPDSLLVPNEPAISLFLQESNSTGAPSYVPKEILILQNASTTIPLTPTYQRPESSANALTVYEPSAVVWSNQGFEQQTELQNEQQSQEKGLAQTTPTATTESTASIDDLVVPDSLSEPKGSVKRTTYHAQPDTNRDISVVLKPRKAENGGLWNLKPELETMAKEESDSFPIDSTVFEMTNLCLVLIQLENGVFYNTDGQSYSNFEMALDRVPATEDRLIRVYGDYSKGGETVFTHKSPKNTVLSGIDKAAEKKGYVAVYERQSIDGKEGIRLVRFRGLERKLLRSIREKEESAYAILESVEILVYAKNEKTGETRLVEGYIDQTTYDPEKETLLLSVDAKYSVDKETFEKRRRGMNVDAAYQAYLDTLFTGIVNYYGEELEGGAKVQERIASREDALDARLAKIYCANKDPERQETFQAPANTVLMFLNKKLVENGYTPIYEIQEFLLEDGNQSTKGIMLKTILDSEGRDVVAMYKDHDPDSHLDDTGLYTVMFDGAQQIHEVHMEQVREGLSYAVLVGDQGSLDFNQSAVVSKKTPEASNRQHPPSQQTSTPTDQVEARRGI